MKTSLNALHHQHTDWLRELDFYKQELTILTARLEEVVRANTSTAIGPQIEHFQNRFILLGEQVDVLKHDVRETEQAVLAEVAAKPEVIHLKVVDTDEQLMDRMQHLAKSIGETRFEFNAFLSKHL